MPNCTASSLPDKPKTTHETSIDTRFAPKMKVIGIIPARYASSRFPGKPLALIHGRSMIRRVWEQAAACSLLDELVVATDDQRIFDHVSAFGRVVMTGQHHPNGTSRCAEAVQQMESQAWQEADVVVNIQGDEPFIQAAQIEQLAGLFQNPLVQIASLAHPIHDPEELFNPHAVKVVMDHTGKALYFSRSPIPACHDAEREQWHGRGLHYRHLGIYAYRLGTLRKLVQLPAGRLETAESLEQLRWLEQGFDIQLGITSWRSRPVDTPADLERLENQMK